MVNGRYRPDRYEAHISTLTPFIKKQRLIYRQSLFFCSAGPSRRPDLAPPALFYNCTVRFCPRRNCFSDRNVMRLAAFIEQEMESILAKWEEFAAQQLPAATQMDSLALRDHARQILEAVAKDLSTVQSREAQLAKSRGEAPRHLSAPETAAETHALLRAKSGFNINQLVAEYRALRATVLRLWTDVSPPERTDFGDMIRFNEAIDQAIAESVNFFNTEVDQARNLFLGMLGHDLRTPLNTIQMTAAYLSAVNADENVSAAALRLIKSGARMRALLDDLLDYNRSKLGLGLNISATSVDVALLFADEVSQLQAVHPDYQLNLSVEGDARGSWDGPRLQQLLSNLIQNAVKYGYSDEPIHVAVFGSPAQVCFEVKNSGPTIDPDTIVHMFEPLKRGLREKATANNDTSLGLGLYIAREIVTAHKGSIEVHSADGQTVFTVRLPR